MFCNVFCFDGLEGASAHMQGDLGLRYTHGVNVSSSAWSKCRAAVGAATAQLDLPTSEVLCLWLQGLCAQLTSAATRFMPLGQTEAQKTLATLAPLITDLAALYASLPLSALSSTTPRADLAAMLHETMPVRIFRT